MDDVLMKFVSAALTGLLVALVGYASVARRRRQVARAEAAAQHAAEDPTQALLRRAEAADRDRDALTSEARFAAALDQARAAVDHWTALTQARPGRFQEQRQNALHRLEELRILAGSV
ncbi:hypothetical protein [Streptomyces sp. NPDC090025]|uniref:hypothetical protein n=1 Tax=Streptomyces sp. NPDC090025 TaxID=3365922 RepID=UPI0038328D9B